MRAWPLAGTCLRSLSVLSSSHHLLGLLDSSTHAIARELQTAHVANCFVAWRTPHAINACTNSLTTKLARGAHPPLLLLKHLRVGADTLINETIVHIFLDIMSRFYIRLIAGEQAPIWPPRRTGRCIVLTLRDLSRIRLRLAVGHGVMGILDKQYSRVEARNVVVVPLQQSLAERGQVIWLRSRCLSSQANVGAPDNEVQITHSAIRLQRRQAAELDSAIPLQDRMHTFHVVGVRSCDWVLERLAVVDDFVHGVWELAHDRLIRLDSISRGLCARTPCKRSTM